MNKNNLKLRFTASIYLLIVILFYLGGCLEESSKPSWTPPITPNETVEVLEKFDNNLTGFFHIDLSFYNKSYREELLKNYTTSGFIVVDRKDEKYTFAYVPKIRELNPFIKIHYSNGLETEVNKSLKEFYILYYEIFQAVRSISDILKAHKATYELKASEDYIVFEIRPVQTIYVGEKTCKFGRGVLILSGERAGVIYKEGFAFATNANLSRIRDVVNELETTA